MDLMQKISGGIAELGRDVLFNGLELGSSYGEAGSMVPPQLQNSVLEMGHISNTCLHLWTGTEHTLQTSLTAQGMEIMDPTGDRRWHIQMTAMINFSAWRLASSISSCGRDSCPEAGGHCFSGWQQANVKYVLHCHSGAPSASPEAFTFGCADLCERLALQCCCSPESLETS